LFNELVFKKRLKKWLIKYQYSPPYSACPFCILQYYIIPFSIQESFLWLKLSFSVVQDHIYLLKRQKSWW